MKQKKFNLQSQEKLNRRQMLGTCSRFALGSFGLYGLGAMIADAAAETNSPRRFLHIMLRGGWDSALATDPVIGSKQSSSSYENAYKAETATSVSGKSNLVIGSGLLPAISAFAAMPTAFVNGIYVEVTAHELALNYALSGRASLSLSREYPALAALLAAKATQFPPHIVLGSRIPLGDSAQASPPLQALSIDALHDMLSGPGKSPAWQQGSIDAANELVLKMDGFFAKKEAGSRASSLADWTKLQNTLPTIYGSGYGTTINLSSEIKTRYGAASDQDNGGFLAGAFLVLKSGLCPYITVTLDGFDTHSNQLTTHKPVMEDFATSMKALVDDLISTSDPTAGGPTLAATTTILISSDFVRTPLFNAESGTDHWQAGASILMGQGVRDNVVIGRTGDDARPLGWLNGTSTSFSSETALTHEHIAAALLRWFGQSEAADAFGREPVSGLFT